MKKFRSDWIDREHVYREITAPDEKCPHYRMEPRRIIVCLCGSTRFKDAWYEQTKRLTHEGFIVLGVGDLNPNKQDTNDPIEPELKAKLDALHLDKIDLADEVFVVSDESGYFGSSTTREIAHAIRGGKTIRWMFESAQERWNSIQGSSTQNS